MLRQIDYIYSQPEGSYTKEGKIIPFINYQRSAPERCLDMLLAKYYGESYQSEVLMDLPEKRSVPELRCDLRKATILLITDGGLVPKGNPDRMPSTNAGKFGTYSLEEEGYEVSHQGYDTSYVEEDYNRLLPIDAMQEMEREEKIGKLCPFFLSTVGVMTSVERSIHLGKQIAADVIKNKVDAVLITSACGTSTRCGAYIGIEIEKRGIPVVQITNLTRIAVDMGVSRVVKGNNICYPCGEPKRAEEGEYLYRRRIVEKALHMLEEICEK